MSKKKIPDQYRVLDTWETKELTGKYRAYSKRRYFEVRIFSVVRYERREYIDNKTNSISEKIMEIDSHEERELVYID